MQTDAAQRIAGAVQQPDVGKALARPLIEDRRLGTGNGHDGPMGPGFDGLGLGFLAEVAQSDWFRAVGCE